MKIEKLKEYITNIVHAELKNVVRDEVKKCISEAFNLGVSNSTESNVYLNTPTSSKHASLEKSSKNENISYSSLLKDNDESITQTISSVRYTKDPVLNAVLNETAKNFKTIPQESGVESAILNFTNKSETINENSDAKLLNTQSTEVKKTAAVFNRDFRSLMKAVDKKIAAKKMI